MLIVDSLHQQVQHRWVQHAALARLWHHDPQPAVALLDRGLHHFFCLVWYVFELFSWICETTTLMGPDDEFEQCMNTLHLHLYPEHLIWCKIPTLHYMQIRGDMIAIYKILSGNYDAAVIPRVNRELSYVTKGNDLRLEIGRSQYDLCKYYFTNSGLSLGRAEGPAGCGHSRLSRAHTGLPQTSVQFISVTEVLK